MIPNNPEAEQSILGTCLISQEATAIALSSMSADDFYQPVNAEIFASISGLFNRGIAVDLVSVATDIQHGGKAGKASMSYISGLTDGIIGIFPLENHCRIVKECSKGRRLLTLAQSVITRAQGMEPLHDIIDDFGSGFAGIVADKSNSAVSVGEIVPGVIEQISYTQKNGNISGLSTGFDAIDRKLVGMANQDLIILAARPSMGKTALAINIASNVAVSGVKVLVFSLEMGKESLTQRMVSAFSSVNGDSLRSGWLNGDDWKGVNRAAGQISSLPMVIDDTPALSITEMQARAKMEHIKGKVGLVVVDYLQLMGAKVGKTGSREQEISAISRGLKGLAKELNVPVLALSQLSRKCEERTDKRPMLSDLRESGAIEQDADVVMFIYRDEVYSKDEFSPNKGMAELIVAKQRNGSTGTDRLLFQGEFSRFLNYGG